MNKIERFFTVVWDAIPELHWWKYASFRLGSFIFAYFCINAGIVLTLAIAGITLGLFGFFAIIPVSVFLAIRLSGAIADKYKE